MTSAKISLIRFIVGLSRCVGTCSKCYKCLIVTWEVVQPGRDLYCTVLVVLLVHVCELFLEMACNFTFYSVCRSLLLYFCIIFINFVFIDLFFTGVTQSNCRGYSRLVDFCNFSNVLLKQL